MCKRRGEMAELAFMHKAMLKGFRVAKPWGDSDRFDLVIAFDHLLWRIQVKSVWTKRVGYYVNSCPTNNKTYTFQEIDFLVAYLGPEELWYILPVSVLHHNRIYLSPWSRRKSQFAKYIEAWCLFRGEQPDEPIFPISRRKNVLPVTDAAPNDATL
jgi:hypothetical protein